MKETVVSPTLQPRLAVQPEDIKTVGNDMSAFDHEEKSWRYTEDGLDVTRGSAWSAPGCHLGCGVLVYSKDGEVVRVEGDPENPYNQGRLCPRCVAVTDIFNNPARIFHHS